MTIALVDIALMTFLAIIAVANHSGAGPVCRGSAHRHLQLALGRASLPRSTQLMWLSPKPRWGAGLATVLFLAALSSTGPREKAKHQHSWSGLAVCLLTGGALIYGTLDMPHLGDPNAPVHQHVAPRYITESPEEIGIPNMVTSVLASYRGYDTLGEVDGDFLPLD